MDYQFWSRHSKRTENPTLSSKLMTNLLGKQPQHQVPGKNDFSKPIKINQRAPDSVRRSYSQVFRPTEAINPERVNPIIETNNSLIKQSSSRISNFGSRSLNKLTVLNSDVQVYEKQRKGREYDIISQVPREYRDVIKVFPKYRFQALDNDYWRRKSFIEGLPQNAYNLYSISNSSFPTKASKFDSEASNKANIQ